MPNVISSGDGLGGSSGPGLLESGAGTTVKHCMRCSLPIYSTDDPAASGSSGSSSSLPLICSSCRGLQPMEVVVEEGEDDDEGVQQQERGRELRFSSTQQRHQQEGAVRVMTPARSFPKQQRSTSREPASPFATSLSPYTATSIPVAVAAQADPWIDVTRFRVRSLGYDCLYPGAAFSGVQTNQQKHHRVSVTIVDVDIATSTLCGFLTIHELTEHHKEITTFFDAQIIAPGSRFGFLTENYEWGATEESDMKHWDQFPAFRQYRHDLKRPNLTIPLNSQTHHGHAGGGSGPVVFMRWKERFLYPDHKVRTISGASYAGFYYICLEFGNAGHTIASGYEGPDHPPSSSSRATPSSVPSEADATEVLDPNDDAATTSPPGFRSASPTPHPHGRLAGGPARLTGYYYHLDKDSTELYQRLTLTHTPEPTRSYFEFR